MTNIERKILAIEQVIEHLLEDVAEQPSRLNKAKGILEIEFKNLLEEVKLND